MPATLKSRLPAIAVELRPRVSGAVKAGAELIAERAKERAPVGESSVDPHPGRLRDSFGVERTGGAEYRVYNDAQADPVAGRSEGAPYAHFVEFGTEAHGRGGGNAPAHPFLIPAAEESREEVTGLVTAVLRGL